jgi:hypothetical protein
VSFAPTAKQSEAISGILAGMATWLMLFGGGRSGKTFLIVRTIVLRALKARLAPPDRALPLRAPEVLNHRGHVPEGDAVCFPGVHYVLSKTDWNVTFDNGSEIWFGGLDEGKRMEKLLGMEFATIYVNEASADQLGRRDAAAHPPGAEGHAGAGPTAIRRR